MQSRLADLAARQHGVVARPQLVALGFSAAMIKHRVATGALHVAYRGVYAVGHRRLTQRGRWMAAVLAAGPGDFLAFLAAQRLPRPQRNVFIEGYECDIVYPDHRLIIELDGGAHRTRTRFESDRLRDRKLTLAGWRIIRVTWRHLHHARKDLANDLTTALASARTARPGCPTDRRR